MDGGEAQSLQFLPGAFFQKYLLDIRRNFSPDISVDHVGGGVEAVEPAIHVRGYFVPALAQPRIGAGYASVQDAALQCGVHFGESHELGRRAHVVNPVGQLGRVAAGLQADEVLRVFQPLVAEEELVVAGDPVAHQHLGAQLFLVHLVQVRGDVGQHLVVGLMVGPQSPDVLHCQGGELAADVSAVNLSHAQSAVSQQAGGIRSGQTQLGEGCNVDCYLPVRPVLDVGNEECALVLAPEQLPVDAGVLQFDILAGRCERRRISQVGLFNKLAIVVRLENPPDVFNGVQRHLAVVIAEVGSIGVHGIGVNGRANQGGEVAVANVDSAGAACVLGGVGFQLIADFPHHPVAFFLFHHGFGRSLGGGCSRRFSRRGSGRGGRSVRRRHRGSRLPARHQQDGHQRDDQGHDYRGSHLYLSL